MHSWYNVVSIGTFPASMMEEVNGFILIILILILIYAYLFYYIKVF